MFFSHFMLPCFHAFRASKVEKISYNSSGFPDIANNNIRDQISDREGEEIYRFATYKNITYKSVTYKDATYTWRNYFRMHYTNDARAIYP